MHACMLKNRQEEHKGQHARLWRVRSRAPCHALDSPHCSFPRPRSTRGRKPRGARRGREGEGEEGESEKREKREKRDERGVQKVSPIAVLTRGGKREREEFGSRGKGGCTTQVCACASAELTILGRGQILDCPIVLEHGDETTHHVGLLQHRQLRHAARLLHERCGDIPSAAGKQQKEKDRGSTRDQVVGPHHPFQSPEAISAAASDSVDSYKIFAN